jgi:arylsulfatase A-like enzyme
MTLWSNTRLTGFAIKKRKPFFLYFSTGATHAPHQVPKQWSDKYKGKFDQGWDKLREETFARQKQLGVIPADAKLTHRDPAFPAWDSVPSDVKKVYARQMEVYAGYQENTDNAVGRVLKAIEDMGLADNTLIIYIFGDNGASMEGTETGTFNEMTTLNGVPLTAEQQLKAIKAYGVGWQRAIQMGQTSGVASRRHSQSDGDLVAETH